MQHPVEIHGIRRVDRVSETRRLTLKTTTGDGFIQERQVPIGSNWPSLKLGEAPRPGVVVRRGDGGAIV